MMAASLFSVRDVCANQSYDKVRGYESYLDSDIVGVVSRNDRAHLP
jgi:hypothetical protein